VLVGTGSERGHGRESVATQVFGNLIRFVTLPRLSGADLPRRQVGGYVYCIPVYMSIVSPLALAKLKPPCWGPLVLVPKPKVP
jgi:hypothetical protein